MARDGKTSPYGDGRGGSGMAKSGVTDLTTGAPPARSGARPMDWTNPTPPTKPSGAGAAASMPSPASFPDGGKDVLPAIDANAGGAAKGSPATIGAPGGGKKSFRVGG